MFCKLGASITAIAAGVVLLFLAPGLGAQGPGRPRFRVVPNNNMDMYFVALRDAGPRGRGSRAAQVAQAVALTHRVQVVSVLQWAANGFIVRMPRGVAEVMSRDPRVEYVEQAQPTRVATT